MTIQPMSQKTRTTWQLLLMSYVSILLILLFSTYAARTDMNWQFSEILIGFFLATFKSIPLLMFIPGLRRQSEQTTAWLSYMSMLYFVFAVLLAFTPGAALWGLLLTIATLTLFMTSMLYTRWRKAEL
ncbi:MAG: DUF2069 domain-containing protein [Bacterioplanes sp.]|nr:DUF2069 domain-containing protein [Bacterioplanes sp.]